VDADDQDVGAGVRRGDGGAQPATARADNQDVHCSCPREAHVVTSPSWLMIACVQLRRAKDLISTVRAQDRYDG
jgi:hypothetical protein